MACATLVINLFKEMAHCKGNFGCFLKVCTWEREYTCFFICLLRTLECMHDNAQLLHMHTVSVCDSNFLCSLVCLFGRKLVLCKLMLMTNLIWPLCGMPKNMSMCYCMCVCVTQHSGLRGVLLGWLCYCRSSCVSQRSRARQLGLCVCVRVRTCLFTVCSVCVLVSWRMCADRSRATFF